MQGEQERTTNAVDVVGQTEEQRLEVRGDGQTPGSARGALAFGGGEDALDERALAVGDSREVRPQLRPNAVELPDGLAPLGGNAAVGAHVGAHMALIGLAVKFGVGQDQANHCRLPGHVDDRT
jgi:hypothetical protein